MTLTDSSTSRAAGGDVPLLEVSGLTVGFPTPDGVVEAVRGIDFTLRRGEVLGIVGESGSGKSVTSTAILGLLPPTARIGGSIRLDGTELVGADDRSMSAIRGKRISMVFQDPLSAFTPVYTVGQQIAETVRIHRGSSKEEARARAIELLEIVGIPDAPRRVDSFPHEFSGGMRQRAMIAMAIANDPDVILADEPTTALDVTIQAQVIAVLRKAQQEAGAALVFVSHDLGVIAGFADRIAVMYAGRIVETATAEDLFTKPRMPYTVGLIGALPRLDQRSGQPLVPIPGTPPSLLNLPTGCPFAARCPLVTDECRSSEPPLAQAEGVLGGHLAACHHSDELARTGADPDEVFDLPELEAGALDGVPRDERETVLHVDGLVKTFPLRRGAVFKRTVGQVWAVDGVDLDIREGETLGLVGESGSGKSTTLHEIMDLRRPEQGSIQVLGTDLGAGQLDGATVRRLRSTVSMVFQDPMASLDPRQPVSDIIAEPLLAAGTPAGDVARRVPALMKMVGLDSSAASRFPHEFSGGQRQRISIARALAASPRLVVLDEPVSALDVSIQAGVLNLLRELKAKLGLSYLFVSHDLSVIRHVADRVSVMYLGRTVETGAVDEVFEHPLHPYTQALLSAVPVPDPARERAREHILLPGDPPNPTEKQVGCRFRGRCPVFAMLGAAEKERCATEVPLALPHGRDGQDHTAACHFPQEKQLV
ncbi:peptide/nickel transport system ATP-binding protein [Frondihabitans sp. PhB188]|uniref:dipeptide ABC transporter ATP-binding protein n=1 Tax=Frondihabitans sp. PhB188 TaxID=2485200 RepID=UPI000F488B50|nr:ABC transporter ATP-binding protein [Frondihabitans sp. PhB188]ROQ38456.1 peptide/nickel transport system ATP-binding protein [Frondihabitans sp. PhB188]